MALIRSQVILGDNRISPELPRIETYSDVVYLPFRLDGEDTWGIYDRRGKLVPATAYLRGPDPELVDGQRYATTIEIDAVEAVAPDCEYIYVGTLRPHYGHVLVTSLPRYWNLEELKRLNLKLLYHSPGDINQYWQLGYVAKLLATLGLSTDNFQKFNAPTRIHRLIVPCSSFQENSFAHRVFGTFCQSIGDRLVDRSTIRPRFDPVYLAKFHLPRGTHKLVNEEELALVLENHGVEIAFPEELDFSDQVALFASHQNICGFLGSAFHTSVFSSQRRMIGVTFYDTILCNYTLIDQLRDHRAIYLFPSDDAERLGGDNRFANVLKLKDPRQTAFQLLRAMEAFFSAGRLRGHSWHPCCRANISKLVTCPNISQGRPADQSSTSDQALQASTSDDAAGGVSGILSGRAQFHTRLEIDPWWQVDLGASSEIHEIRIYNRIDLQKEQERAAHIHILTSPDGLQWNEQFRRTETRPFGGLDGDPLIWSPERPLQARFVRVQLPGLNALHLDQVEVYGQVPPASETG